MPAYLALAYTSSGSLTFRVQLCVARSLDFYECRDSVIVAGMPLGASKHGGLMKKMLIKSGASAAIAGALAVSLLAVGIAPASASEARSGDSLTRPTADGLEIPKTKISPKGNEILTTAGNAESSVSLALPGEVTTPSPSDLTAVPAGLFHGNDPLLKTDLTEASVTAYATAYGSQSIISVEGSSAPREYRFDLGLPEGSVATVSEDGSVRITDDGGQPLGLVHAPWAYDANGVKVPTSFSLVGSDLVQTIAHDTTTAYPVKADPSIQWIPMPVLAVWGSEIRVFNTIQVALAAGGAWAGCTFSRLSGVLAKIVSQICTVVGVAGVAGVVNTVASVWGNSGVNGATCYGVPLYNPRGALTVMPARDCY